MSDTDNKRLYAALRALMKEKEKTDKVLATLNEPIAIVGMACRFPGGANSPEKFWQNLCAGVDSASAIPKTRWDQSVYYNAQRPLPGKIYTQNAHFIDDYAHFDAEFFGVTPKEVDNIDPQQRILLELTLTAFENGLLPMQPYRGSQTGVFIGHFTHDYGSLLTKYVHDTEISAYATLGNSACTASGRISYQFGFQGPSMPINTACSSSLVAAHLACQSLRLGECDLAVVGGANLMLSPEIMINICQAQMLSSDGRCHSFDKSANGYGRGEGAAIILLKRLSDAIKNRDVIEAIIVGSATNQDGASSALTVPNGKSQAMLLSAVLNKFNLSPKNIDYIEAHGTGTALGDPIEINAINQVYRDSHQPTNPLYVSTVKTNVGHLEAAAGVAALIKVALCLKHKMIPPHLHLETLNPAIDLDAVPIKIPTELTQLRNHDSSTAAISSFGFSGSNAHMILQTAPAELLCGSGKSRPYYLTKLSAKSPIALTKLMHDTVNFLDQQKNLSMADFSYSCNVGRDDYAYRIAITSTDISDYRNQLEILKNQPYVLTKRDLCWYFATTGLSNDKLAEIIPFIDRELATIFEKINHISGIQISLSDLQLLNTANPPPLRHCEERSLRRSNPELSHGSPRPSASRPLDDESREVTPKYLLEFALYFAIGGYYKSLGLLPKIAYAEGLSLFSVLALSEKISLDDAISLVIAASENRLGLENNYQKLVDDVKISSGLFPLFIANTTSLREYLLTFSFLTCQLSADFSQKHSNDVCIGNQFLNNDSAENMPLALSQQFKECYESGHDLKWHIFEFEFEQQKIQLPNYPWQKQEFISPILKRMRAEQNTDLNLLYQTSYQQQAIKPPIAKNKITYLCFIADSVMQTDLLTAIRDSGNDLIIVNFAKHFARLAENVYTVDANSYQDIHQLLNHINQPFVALYTLPLQSQNHSSIDLIEEMIKHDVLFMKHYHQAVVDLKLNQHFYYLTRDAYTFKNNTINLPSATIVGLLKAINFEYATTRYISVDFSTHRPVQEIIENILIECADHETQIVYRDKQRFVPRLQSLQNESGYLSQVSFKNNKSYVITGGLGGLGLSLAAELIKNGAGCVHLLSRRSPDARLQMQFKQWCVSGGQVETHQIDILKDAELYQCLDRIQQESFPIAGLFHLAGIDERAAFIDYDWATYSRVMQAKLKGAWYLHQYSQKLSLDYFVLFSSVASSIGSSRQAPYVTANAFLDGLANLRHSLGLPAQSINWGPWSEVGMVQGDATVVSRMDEHLFSQSEGLSLFTQLLSTPLTQVTVVKTAFLNFMIRFFKEYVPGYLQLLIPEIKDTLTESSVVLELKNALPSQYEEIIETYLLTGFRQVTGWNSHKLIDIEQSFFDMGLDSLMAVELAEYCSQGFASLITLPPTLLFDAVNMKSLISYINDRVVSVLQPRTSSVQAEQTEFYSEDDIKNMSSDEIDAIIAGVQEVKSDAC